jgi:hypothetical protein
MTSCTDSLLIVPFVNLLLWGLNPIRQTATACSLFLTQPPLARSDLYTESWDQSSGLQLFRGSARALVKLCLRCSAQ